MPSAQMPAFALFCLVIPPYLVLFVGVCWLHYILHVDHGSTKLPSVNSIVTLNMIFTVFESATIPIDIRYWTARLGPVDQNWGRFNYICIRHGGMYLPFVMLAVLEAHGSNTRYCLWWCALFASATLYPLYLILFPAARMGSAANSKKQRRSTYEAATVKIAEQKSLVHLRLRDDRATR